MSLGDGISVRVDMEGNCWFVFTQQTSTGFYYELAVLAEDVFESSVESVSVGSDGFLFLMDEDMTFFGAIRRDEVIMCEMDAFLEMYPEASITTMETIAGSAVEMPDDYMVFYYDRGSEWLTEETLVVVCQISLGDGGLILGAAMNFEEFDVRLIETMRQVSVSTMLEIGGVLLLVVLIAVLFVINRKGAMEMAILKEKNELMEEINRQQQSLAHTERLQQLGVMTSGIAHEFNNLLTPIMGQSMLLLEELTGQEDSPQFESALDIYEASEKAKGIVKRMSDMSKKEANRPFYPIEVRSFLEKTSNLAFMAKDPLIHLEIDAPEWLYVEGDERLLMQAVLNLSINACQAMGDEGTLTLAARQEQRNGLPYVCMSVSDTGPGIPENLIGSIYEPFFTTKGERGTGLGLAISQKIVETHKGTITATNRPEGGAMFSVRLPQCVDVESRYED